MRRHWPTAALLAAALLIGACGADDSDDPGDGTSAAGADDGGSAGCDADESNEAVAEDPVEPGERTLVFDDEERTYLLALPDDHDETAPLPLVFSFHGWSVSKEAHEASVGMAEEGAARGYAVVTPEGSGDPLGWNIFSEEGADNYGFVEALLGELSEQLCIDPGRVYAAGHSEGSAFAGFLLCREPHHFAAAAMVAAFIPLSCSPEDAEAPAVVAFHGTADPLVPYEGGEFGGPVPIPAAVETFDAYVGMYSCEETTADETVPGVERRAASGCNSGSGVVLYSIENGGHEWPDDDDFRATDVILDFFDEQAR